MKKNNPLEGLTKQETDELNSAFAGEIQGRTLWDGSLSDMVPRTDDERAQKLELVAKQTKQVHSTGIVTCECGNTVKVYGLIYKCFYCGVWFCHKCAKRHFGEMKENKEIAGG